MKPEQPEIFAVGDRVKFLRLNEDMTAGDVDDETLGAGVVIAVRVAPADVLMRETYKSLRDDPVTKDFLADSLAQMREALLSGQLRGLMWDAIEVQLDIGGDLWSAALERRAPRSLPCRIPKRLVQQRASEPDRARPSLRL